MMIFNCGKGFAIGRTHRETITSPLTWEFWNKGGAWLSTGKVFKTREKAEKRLAKLKEEASHVTLHDDGINLPDSTPPDRPG